MDPLQLHIELASPTLSPRNELCVSALFFMTLSLVEGRENSRTQNP